MIKNIDKIFKISIAVVCWAAIGILIVYLIHYFYDLFAICIISIAISYILMWPVKKIEQSLPDSLKFNKRAVAAMITYISSIILLIVACSLLIQPVSKQILELGQSLPGDLKSLEVKSVAYWNKLSSTYNIAPIEKVFTEPRGAKLPDYNSLSSEDKKNAQVAIIEQKLLGEVEKLANYGVPVVPGMISGAFRKIIYILIIGLMSFYLIMSEGTFQNWVKSFFSKNYLEKITQIENKINLAISAYIRGQALIGLGTALIMWFVYYCFDIKYALVLAILVGVAQFVPVIGHTIAITAALIVALTQDPLVAIYILIIFLILMAIVNNIFVPVLLGDMTGLNPVFVIIALVIGERLAGVLGVFIAVPVALIIKILIIHLWPDNLMKQQDTRELQTGLS